jgi:phytoene dehydrogenase-like protein
LIVGAGPVGLYAAYYAGFRGMTTAVVDSLPEPGGQIAALYPEKPIYDVAGGACEVVCPVTAISSDLQIDAADVPWRDNNTAFFDAVLPGRDEPLGSPGGAADIGPIPADAPPAASSAAA